MREGLKRRAGLPMKSRMMMLTRASVPARAKGFQHREMMVGWAILSHNLWVLARLERSGGAEGNGDALLEAA
jgi:hypothetical protein